MRVKNKTEKIITIGKQDILPDAVGELSAAEEKNPAVAFFVERKFLVPIPEGMDEVPEESPDDIAKRIKAMKKDDLIAACAEHEIAAEGKTVAQLRQALVEALV